MTGHRLVLVGGGHAHVQVIRALAQQPEPGMTITLVTDRASYGKNVGSWFKAPTAPGGATIPAHVNV